MDEHAITDYPFRSPTTTMPPKEMPSAGISSRTREANKKAHPAFSTGFRKEWGTRRTSAQVAADDKKADAAKRKEEKAQKKLTSRVAVVEDTMRTKDIRWEAEANHPPDIVPPRVPVAVPTQPPAPATNLAAAGGLGEAQDDEQQEQHQDDPGLESGKP
jgi:hypothetical protein